MTNGYKCHEPHEQHGMASDQTNREITTISLREKTKHRLTKHGNKGMSYDEILTMLLDEYEELHAAREQLRAETGYYKNEP